MRKKRPAHDHSGGFGLAATAATASRHTGAGACARILKKIEK
jgi:hypothetical protein